MTIANNVVAKSAAVVAGLALVFSSFAVAVPAKAATVAELEAQVAALLAQLQALQGGTTTTGGAAFTADMTIGASGAEVTRLQNWLISKGYAIPAGATGYFGAQTAAALAKYQAAKGISPAVGYFGPMTRAAVNAEAGSTTGTPTTPGGTTGGLQGGAGSIETSIMSSINNEKVGEGESDVEVLGVEVEADDASDVELTAVRVVFARDTATATRFEKFADEVSIMLDGDVVATLDADEFTRSNSYTKTISLDKGAIIRRGDTGELVVAVSGARTIDSGNQDKTWTVKIDTIRFRDADGATVSESGLNHQRTMTFTSFATSASATLKLSLTNGADDINDARVIDIDDLDDTDNVEILAFTLEAKGNSDLLVDEIPVLLTATGFDLEDGIVAVRLLADGVEIGSETIADGAGATEVVTFDDLDFTIDSGDKVNFTVEVDLASVADGLANGNTLRAQITADELEDMVIELESGDDLATNKRSGTASADAHGLYEAGIKVKFVSADARVSYTGDISNTNDHDRGTFTITFDVTAFDSDVYLDRTAIAALGGGGGTYQDLSLDSGAGTVTGTVSSSNATTAANETYRIPEDQTRRFTITAVAVPTEDGFFAVRLDSVLYALTAIGGDVTYAFNMNEFVTPQVYLNFDTET